VKIAKILLTILVAVELAAGGVLSAWRLNSTQPFPPPASDYTDAMTARELLALPDGYLFDSLAKWRDLSENYMAFGFFAKADACLRRAALCDPNSHELMFIHGYCLERLGRLDEARNEFRRVAANGSNQDSQRAWYRLGRIGLQLEQPEEAAEAFKSAGDDHVPSVYQRAKLLVRSGESAAAESLLAVLEERFPNDVRIWQLRAQAAANLGQTETAATARDEVERARTVLEFDDIEHIFQPIRNGLGLGRAVTQAESIANRAQDPEDFAPAARLLTEAIRPGTRWQNRYLLLIQDAAEMQARAQNMAAVGELVSRQLDEDKLPTARAWALRGEAAFARNDYGQAFRDWSRAELFRPNAVQQIKMAMAAEHLGNLPDAKRHLALAGQFDGINYFRGNDLANAKMRLQQAITIDADLPETWLYLGESERLTGNKTQAEAAYRRCLALNPAQGRAREGLRRLGKTP
jgi:tetratricopeptide (TPR) repeat protein